LSGVAGIEHLAQRADAEAFLQIGQPGQLWCEHAIHQHQPTHARDGVKLQGGTGTVQRRGIRHGG
jgi:hypothetical protein